MIRADIRIAHLSEEVIQRGARIVLLHIVCNALDLVICKAAGSGFCNDILDMTDGFRLSGLHIVIAVFRLAGVIDPIVAEAPCSVFEPVVDEVIIVVPLKILISGNAGRNGIERIIVVGGEIDLISLERVVGCKVIGIQLFDLLLIEAHRRVECNLAFCQQAGAVEILCGKIVRNGLCIVIGFLAEHSVCSRFGVKRIEHIDIYIRIFIRHAVLDLENIDPDLRERIVLKQCAELHGLLLLCQPVIAFNGHDLALQPLDIGQHILIIAPQLRKTGNGFQILDIAFQLLAELCDLCIDLIELAVDLVQLIVHNGHRALFVHCAVKQALERRKQDIAAGDRLCKICKARIHCGNAHAAEIEVIISDSGTCCHGGGAERNGCSHHRKCCKNCCDRALGDALSCRFHTHSPFQFHT